MTNLVTLLPFVITPNGSAYILIIVSSRSLMSALVALYNLLYIGEELLLLADRKSALFEYIYHLFDGLDHICIAFCFPVGIRSSNFICDHRLTPCAAVTNFRKPGEIRADSYRL